MKRIHRTALAVPVTATLVASIGILPGHAGPKTVKGDQVRLPGGAWVRCGINCYHTLRNATVDFWRHYDAPVTLPYFQQSESGV